MKKLLFFMLFFPLSVLAQINWNYLPNSPYSKRFDDIYFVNDSTGWAVNGDGQIYNTEDYGNSWKLQFVDSFLYFRSVEFLDNKNGFIGTIGKYIYHTTDGGLNWKLIDQKFPDQFEGVCGIGHFGNTIIMVGIWSYPAYILRSTDAGQTWSFMNMQSYSNGLVDCWFKSQDTVFISGQGTSAAKGLGIILRSTDGGITWAQVAESENGKAYCWKLQFTSPLIGYSSCEEFYSQSSHILKTIDGGASWSSLIVVNQNIDMEGIGFVNDSTGWVGGWSNGMYQTNDGGKNWAFKNFGRNINRFIFRNSKLGYAAGSSIYLFSDSSTIKQPPVPVNDYVHTFDLFPNPSNEILKIKLKIFKDTYAIFDIYDVTGKLMKELKKGQLLKNTYNYEFNVSNIPVGTYYAVLRTNEHFLTKAFSVIK